MEDNYATIRDTIGDLKGETIVEITQHDQEYFERTGRCFVDLMLSSGDVLRFYWSREHTGPTFMVNPDEDIEKKAFEEEPDES